MGLTTLLSALTSTDMQQLDWKFVIRDGEDAACFLKEKKRGRKMKLDHSK